jgi:hypothetical protein
VLLAGKSILTCRPFQIVDASCFSYARDEQSIFVKVAADPAIGLMDVGYRKLSFGLENQLKMTAAGFGPDSAGNAVENGQHSRSPKFLG